MPRWAVKKQAAGDSYELRTGDFRFYDCDGFRLVEKLFTILRAGAPRRAISRCHNWLRSLP
jgi:hypothetical protein